MTILEAEEAITLYNTLNLKYPKKHKIFIKYEKEYLMLADTRVSRMLPVPRS
jgi:hypothetical protein